MSPLPQLKSTGLDLSVMAGRCSLTSRRPPRPIPAQHRRLGPCSATAGRLRRLLLLLHAFAAAQLEMQPNRTTVECEAIAVARSSRANCTITTRNGMGVPTGGALASDFTVVHSPELLDASPIQGGPIRWFLDFATCEAGVCSALQP